jgi:hypothetical protein
MIKAMKLQAMSIVLNLVASDRASVLDRGYVYRIHIESMSPKGQDLCLSYVYISQAKVVLVFATGLSNRAGSHLLSGKSHILSHLNDSDA